MNAPAPVHIQNVVIARIVADWDRRADSAADFGSLGTLSYGEALVMARRDEEVFYTLLVESVNGNPAARHTLMRAMLPKCIRFGLTCRKLARDSRDEAYTTAIACLWSAIVSYPLHRRKNPAGQLAMRTLEIITTAVPEDRLECVPYTATYMEQLEESDEFARRFDPNIGSENARHFSQVLRVLEWAVTTPASTGRGMIFTRDEAHLLGQWSIFDVAEREQICTSTGKSYEALERKVYRLRDRLAREISHHELTRDAFDTAAA
jgi:hypothetical protein